MAAVVEAIALRSQPAPMIHGNGVVAGESLPATTVSETARTVPCHLYPAQEYVQVALPVPSVNGKVGEAEVAHAEAAARVRVAQAKAKAEEMKARVAHIEAAEANKLAFEAVKTARAETAAKAAEAEAKFRAARALEAEEIAVARARAATKVKMATAEALEADLKIVKLRKELEVLTGESEVKEYLCSLSLRPSLCPSLTACFSDLNSSPYSVFASVFLFFSF